MSKSNPKISTLSRTIFILFFICIICSPSWALGDASNWIKWLLDLIAADTVPQRPELTEEDQAAIEKTRILLQEYPPDAGNSMLLGIFAAANGQADEAQERFMEAVELNPERSLLPLTMAAQTHLQEKNFDQAVEIHEFVLQQLEERSETPRIQAINAHLDLVVAYSKLEETQRANEQMERATELLSTDTLSDRERAFSYLQLGIVQQEVLKNKEAAIKAWEEGSNIPAENPRLALELNLKVARNIADTDPKNAEKYLSRATQITESLPKDSKIAAQVQLGEQYTKLTKLAIRRKDKPAIKRLSLKADQLLKPAIEQKDIESTKMILYKTTALEVAKELSLATGNVKQSKEYQRRISAVRNDLILKIAPPKKMVLINEIKIPQRDLKRKID